MTLHLWQKKMALPTLILSLVYTASFVYPIYWYPVGGGVKLTCEIIYYMTWAIFAIDYMVQIKLAPDNKKYLKTHFLELILVVVPV